MSGHLWLFEPARGAKSLRAEELEGGDIFELWERFYNAHGPKVMDEAYGWDEVRDVQAGEHVWAFFADAHEDAPCIGWGSVRLNLMDDSSAYVAAGVFPEYQRKGYRMQILDWMTEWAKKYGLSYLITETSLVNAAQLGRKFRESVIDGTWEYAGTITLPPPGYAVFVRTIEEEDE